MEIQLKYNSVLLLDDNDIDNMVNKKLIENGKFCKEILVHVSARETLNFLKSQNTEELPDVIFLDIMMPGMDGFAFLEEFEKLPDSIHKKCKVIMLSTSDSFKDLNRANKNKFVRKFLNKPLTEEMLAAINL